MAAPVDPIVNASVGHALLHEARSDEDGCPGLSTKGQRRLLALAYHPLRRHYHYWKAARVVAGQLRAHGLGVAYEPHLAGPPSRTAATTPATTSPGA